MIQIDLLNSLVKAGAQNFVRDEERAKTFLLYIFEENASRCIYQVVSVVLSNCKSEHMMCMWK